LSAKVYATERNVMPEGTESVSEAIASMHKLMDRLGKKNIDFGVNADGWEFLIVNKYDKPVVAGKISAADNIVEIARTEVHFDQAVVLETVGSADSIDRLEGMEIPPGGTAKIKGGRHAWLEGWPAGCAFWFKEPEGGTFESYCSIAIDVSTSVLELGAVTRLTVTGLGSPLEASFPSQHADGAQSVYLQRG
jgi:hypothetical protein